MFYPIDPVIDSKNVLPSLVPEFGIQNSTLDKSLLPGKKFSYENFEVVQDVLSVNIASKLNLSSIISNNLDYSSKAYYFDSIAFTNKSLEGVNKDSNIIGTRWGVGLRIIIAVSNIQTNFDFNLGSIGAAVQLGMARARYEIKGMGLGHEGLEIVLSRLSSMDDFTVDTYLTIKEKIVPRLGKFMKDNISELKPQPIAVKLRSQPVQNNLTIGRTVFYTIKAIIDRKSLNECFSKGIGGHDESIIREVYREIVGSVDPDDRPSREAVMRAKDWVKS